MGARRHGQEWALVPLGKCCKVFLCICSYSKTLSGRIIYALFSQPVVGFWGSVPKPPLDLKITLRCYCYYYNIIIGLHDTEDRLPVMCLVSLSFLQPLYHFCNRD